MYYYILNYHGREKRILFKSVKVEIGDQTTIATIVDGKLTTVETFVDGKLVEK